MSFFHVIIAFMLLTFIPHVKNVNAAVQKDMSPLLKIRTGYHADFLRIVLEGPGNIISKGRVSQREKNILVRFPDTSFNIKKEKLTIICRTDRDVVIFTPGKLGKIKTFSLNSPSRIVIDIYQEKAKKEKSKTEKDKKKETKPTVKLSKETPVKERENIIPPNPPLKKGGMEGFSEQSSKIQKNETSVTDSIKDKSDEDFIPRKYKKLWDLFKSGKSYGVIKELQEYKKEDPEYLAVYHFIYGLATGALKNYLDAVKHLRLAYIYATDNRLKELALFKRAETYMKLKFIYEARADYLVFIKNYPSSSYIEKAHLGLAKCLSEINLYGEAVEHYEKAGPVPEALFGKANSLQILGKVREAQIAYNDALSVDKTYPKRYPETYYLIGENMRMAGKITEAKRHLSTIKHEPFKDKANISLGLIAMEESDTEKAVQKFKSAAKSMDEKVRVQALFNLSQAFLREDKLQESIYSLEEIRHNHINSSMYKKTLLELSRLYRKDGRVKDSISLLKELVYGKQPPEEAFDEFETILLEASKETRDKAYEEVDFVELWNEVGKWMLDKSREEFLIKVAKNLRHEVASFLRVSSWIVENGSEIARCNAAMDLANYYVGVGNVKVFRKYIDIAKKSKELRDDVLRAEAKMYRAYRDHKTAFNRLSKVKKYEKGDFKLLGNIISSLKKSEPERVAEVIDFYEKALNEFEGDGEDYIRLADFLFEDNKEGKALKYYRMAYRKKPEDEWAMYRISRAVNDSESKEIFHRLQKGSTLLSGLAKTKLMEIDLENRIRKVF